MCSYALKPGILTVGEFLKPAGTKGTIIGIFILKRCFQISVEQTFAGLDGAKI